MECKDAAYCYFATGVSGSVCVCACACACVRACVRVCVCVCLLITTTRRAETAEPIEMPFGVWTPVGPEKHVRWGFGSPKTKGQFLGAKCYFLLAFYRFL